MTEWWHLGLVIAAVVCAGVRGYLFGYDNGVYDARRGMSKPQTLTEEDMRLARNTREMNSVEQRFRFPL